MDSELHRATLEQKVNVPYIDTVEKHDVIVYNIELQ